VAGRTKGEPEKNSHESLNDDRYRKSLEHPDIMDYRTVAEVLANKDAEGGSK